MNHRDSRFSAFGPMEWPMETNQPMWFLHPTFDPKRDTWQLSDPCCTNAQCCCQPPSFPKGIGWASRWLRTKAAHVMRFQAATKLPSQRRHLMQQSSRWPCHWSPRSSNKTNMAQVYQPQNCKADMNRKNHSKNMKRHQENQHST